MINEYQFGHVEDSDCFEDDITNILYFPVIDSPDFPKAIRDKAEEMIDSIIHTYEIENNCKLDLSKLCLNARICVYKNKSGEWQKEIAVLISGSMEFDDIWIEKSCDIILKDILYDSFKEYFIVYLEKELFRKQV